MKQHLNTLLIAIAVIIAGYLLATGYKNRAKVADSVSVTGLGESNFVSDLIVWRGSFSRRAMDLKTVNADLNKDQEAIERYLISKGLKADEIVFEGASIYKDYTNDYDENGQLRNSIFNGYVLTQNLKVESKQVDLVEDLSRKVTNLIEMGIEFNSYSPQFYYTKLSELKLKMIEEATSDARLRAVKIVEEAGSKLGRLKHAEMGVFQITGEHSSEEYSWGGSYNTSSKNKTATITIRLKYEID